MTVTRVHHDPAALTMTVESAFDAPVARAWQLWADPRLLERWWGPPTHPATVVDHELRPEGTVRYFMTSPEGEKYHGWWRVVAVDAPHRLEFDDGFADDSGTPNPDMPVTRIVVTLGEAAPGRTEMTIVSTFPSAEALEQMLAMGMEEGMAQALGQADALLAA